MAWYAAHSLKFTLHKSVENHTGQGIDLIWNRHAIMQNINIGQIYYYVHCK